MALETWNLSRFDLNQWGMLDGGDGGEYIGMDFVVISEILAMWDTFFHGFMPFNIVYTSSRYLEHEFTWLSSVCNYLFSIAKARIGNFLHLSGIRQLIVI